ncbi:MAG: ribulose-bisphosphate carboxylase large subunit, partial [Candidatus Aenigmatarchaeota archaeon]
MSYVNLGYKPKKDDLICKFYVEPRGKRSVKDVSEHVAAESSTGTWTRVHTEKRYIQELSAKVFDIKKNIVQIAYP